MDSFKVSIVSLTIKSLGGIGSTTTKPTSKHHDSVHIAQRQSNSSKVRLSSIPYHSNTNWLPLRARCLPPASSLHLQANVNYHADAPTTSPGRAPAHQSPHSHLNQPLLLPHTPPPSHCRPRNRRPGPGSSPSPLRHTYIH